MERGRYIARVARGERRSLPAVPTEPWLCSQLLLAPPSATLRILLYFPVCRHLLRSLLLALREMFDFVAAGVVPIVFILLNRSPRAIFPARRKFRARTQDNHFPGPLYGVCRASWYFSLRILRTNFRDGSFCRWESDDRYYSLSFNRLITHKFCPFSFSLARSCNFFFHNIFQIYSEKKSD